MRPRLARLLCWGVLLLPAPLVRAQLSERVRAEIQQALPKYDPKASAPKPAADPPGKPAPLSDDPVVHLPAFYVVSPRAPGADPDAWLTPSGLKAKALKEYKDSMNPLLWALNWWHIPFLTPSAQARADAAHANAKLAREVGRLSDEIGAISRIDPDYARAVARDLDLSRHPSN